MPSTSLSNKIVELIDKLKLQPHPEGGFYRETWRLSRGQATPTDLCLPRSILPAEYTGDRAAGTAILFLLPTGHFSRWHRVRSAELWFHQSGDPLELVMAETLDGATQIINLGRDYAFQAIVLSDRWQKAKPLPGEAGYVLVACVVVPGFDFADFELIGES
jgi:uncharacterized protein